MAVNFRFSIKTMGCKANVYDSLLLERELVEMGGRRTSAHSSDGCDVFILNSCTVTEEADKQCHQEINRIKKKKPDVITLVTGCYAEVDQKALKENSNIEYVVPNSGKNNLKQILGERLRIKNLPQENLDLQEDVYWGQLPLERDKTRVFLKIQEGCNDYCTYCIIPYARGKSRSVQEEKIYTEINRLIENGVKEIVLTGTNIADYGKEWGKTLDDLVEGILKNTRLSRLRLSSLDPSEITDRLLEVMASPHSRLMPHFHVSLQSAQDRVLRTMKRHYRTSEIVSALEKIYKTNSEIFVGMDIIAGFPTETKEEHKETLDLLRSLPWTRLHVFPYSERSGTPATKLAPVPTHERKQRAAELMQLSHRRHEQYSKTYIGKKIDSVLFESIHEVGFEKYLSGHARNYLRILAKLPPLFSETDAQKLLNTTGGVSIESTAPIPAQDWTLEGTLIL